MLIKQVSHRQGILLLVLTTLVWGTTFPVVKDAIASLSPGVLISSRFLLATLVLAPFCRSINRSLLMDGVLLGAPLFIAFVTQVIGLESIPANRSAFIVSLNVILVPLLSVLVGRRLSVKIAIAAGLAIVGVGVMSWEGGAFAIGDLWTFGCALSYAVYILILESIAPKHPLLSLTAAQLAVVTLLGLIWTGPELWVEIQAIQMNLGVIVYLGVMATAVTTWTQVVAQRALAATEVAIVYTLEPLFATVFSFLWLGEQLGQRGLLGAAIVLAATLLSQL